jgi:hypothetical protein
MGNRPIFIPLTVIILAGTFTCAYAQWRSYPDSRIPRTKDGKPNLTAPAVREIATDGEIQTAVGDAIQLREIHVQHDLVTTSQGTLKPAVAPTAIPFGHSNKRVSKSQLKSVGVPAFGMHSHRISLR